MRDPSDATRTEDWNLLDATEPPNAGDDAGLVLIYAPEPSALPQVVPLSSSEPLVIGREPPSGGLAIPSTAVSRVHARIHATKDGFVVTDLDSRNGTVVNGARVESAGLEAHDEVRIGDAIYAFVESELASYAGHRIDRDVSAGEAVAGPRLQAVLSGLAAVAPTNLPILILGETGTGKEIAANVVHAASGRTGALAALNCAALPTQILESELFGHRRGAFTGADRDKPGLVGTADGGTLFLDEVGELAIEAQAKLLRVLETGELLPLGAARPERVDVRFVAATNRDLSQQVSAGRFRADLLARLSGHVALLPPLRQRKEDLVPLVRHLFAKHGRSRAVLSPPSAAALCHYDWPYNVRELESVVRRAIALLDAARARPDAPLELEHLPRAIVDFLVARGRESAPPVASPSSPAPDAAALRQALERHRGNVAAVARELGKDRVQIHRWMRRHGLDPNDFRG